MDFLKTYKPIIETLIATSYKVSIVVFSTKNNKRIDNEINELDLRNNTYVDDNCDYNLINSHKLNMLTGIGLHPDVINLSFEKYYDQLKEQFVHYNNHTINKIYFIARDAYLTIAEEKEQITEGIYAKQNRMITSYCDLYKDTDKRYISHIIWRYNNKLYRINIKQIQTTEICKSILIGDTIKNRIYKPNNIINTILKNDANKLKEELYKTIPF